MGEVYVFGKGVEKKKRTAGQEEKSILSSISFSIKGVISKKEGEAVLPRRQKLGLRDSSCIKTKDSKKNRGGKSTKERNW